MNFSTQVKNEILSKKLENPCCQLAALAGFLRTAGSIEIKNGIVGFSVLSEEKQLTFFSQVIFKLFGEMPTVYIENNKLKRAKLELISIVSQKILEDIGIITVDNGVVEVVLNISNYVIENECCKRAYVLGAFLGSGTITVPNIEGEVSTGYHLEFVFSKYVTATEFCDLFSELGFFAKLIERKEVFVVYLKNVEEINDFLVKMGATQASFSLTDVQIRRNIKNNLNRAFNCEMSNMNKQIDARLKDKEAIGIIKETIGIDFLPKPLQEVCTARLKFKELSLTELADSLNISKSCLCHRLRKINEIAKGLK